MAEAADCGRLKNEWCGDPVFYCPGWRSDGSQTNVFHRDKPGWVIATFHGPNSRVMAERFCELFGEADGSGISENA